MVRLGNGSSYCAGGTHGAEGSPGGVWMVKISWAGWQKRDKRLTVEGGVVGQSQNGVGAQTPAPKLSAITTSWRSGGGDDATARSLPFAPTRAKTLAP